LQWPCKLTIHRDREIEIRQSRSGCSRELTWRHADNCERTGVHYHTSADDCWVSPKAPLPQAMTQNDYCPIINLRSFIFGEGATERGIDSQRREVISRTHHRALTLCGTACTESNVH